MSETTRRRIREALQEDVGPGDWTTTWCVPERLRVRGEFVAGGAGVIAGLAAAAEVYRCLGDAELEPLLVEGDRVAAGAIVARVLGFARSVLTGERLALNFLMGLSGIATTTRRFVDAVEGTGARITDTRKTTPLWRELERAATRAGGAVNHRFGLFDMILIKDNHLACSGGVAAAVERARASNDRGLRIEVETTNLDQVREALAAGVNRIMLDNMSTSSVREAVGLIRERASGVEIEASGGVGLDSVRELAEAGVDFISIGALTHSAPALDLSLRLQVADP